MYVFDAGVVHAATAPGFGGQGAFKYRPEDGGADVTPAEAEGGFFQYDLYGAFIEFWYFNVPIKKTAIDIGKSSQLIVKIFITFTKRRI